MAVLRRPLHPARRNRLDRPRRARGPLARIRGAPGVVGRPAGGLTLMSLRLQTRAFVPVAVVVVGLYDPDAAVDTMALAEAKAGAQAAGAGFVALNVLAESQSRPLLELLGTLENPSVLVYRRPDTLFARIGGFADRETVAQAAANAKR